MKEKHEERLSGPPEEIERPGRPAGQEESRGGSGPDADDREAGQGADAGEAGGRRLGAAIFILVALLFIGVICLTDLVEILVGRALGETAGKVWGTVAMAALAAVIAAALYRREIKAWFSKRFGGSKE